MKDTAYRIEKIKISKNVETHELTVTEKGNKFPAFNIPDTGEFDKFLLSNIETYWLAKAIGKNLHMIKRISKQEFEK